MCPRTPRMRGRHRLCSCTHARASWPSRGDACLPLGSSHRPPEPCVHTRSEKFPGTIRAAESAWSAVPHIHGTTTPTPRDAQAALGPVRSVTVSVQATPHTTVSTRGPGLHARSPPGLPPLLQPFLTSCPGTCRLLPETEPSQSSAPGLRV